MDDPELRICPFCAEGIKAKARVCPRCRQWLTLRSFRHPLVFMLCHTLPMLAIWIAGALVIFSRIEDLQNPKPYYSEFPNSLRVNESRMNWAQTRDGVRIFLVGVVTNASPIMWRGLEFDCRFFDAHGALVDATPGYGRVSACPNDATAFRVSVIPTAPTNDYAAFTISVSHATSATGLF